ncbi:MAG: hypothetical protein NUV60_01525 [Patescibacteria group bacterium]|nr:hypothetical protein [Patescibacteria group bacterium]
MNLRLIIALSFAVLFTFGVAVFLSLFYFLLGVYLVHDYVCEAKRTGSWWPSERRETETDAQ